MSDIEWEDAEKQRIADIRERINDFDTGDNVPETVQQWTDRIAWIESPDNVIDESFAEFAAEAATAKDRAMTIAKTSLVIAQEYAQFEADEMAEAEEYAARKAEQVKQAAVAQRQQIEQERLDAERREHEAIERATRAEANAQKQADEAAARAKQQAEQQRKADADAARAADIDHRSAINREALTGIIAAGVTEPEAIAILTAIIKGKISHIEVKY